jgi:hypothetical protein
VRKVYTKKEKDILEILKISEERLEKELSIEKIVKRLRKLDIMIDELKHSNPNIKA